MQRIVAILAILIITGLVILTGCDDRGLNVPTTDYNPWQISPRFDHSFSRHLTFQLSNFNEVWLGSAYIPREAIGPPYVPQPQRVPVLILLPPQGGDKFYFFKHGLLELAQEMIDNNEIQPMVIYTPANAQAFDGFMYGNSMPAGWVDSIIRYNEDDPDDLNSMLNWLFEIVPSIIQTNPNKRGIGGIGMGGYGAFRAALKHPGTFGSITSSDGPLDFDGSGGSGGFIDLFDDVQAEQLMLNPNFTPDSFRVAFDTGSTARGMTLPLSKLFAGAGLAFSPYFIDIDWQYNSFGDFTISDTIPLDVAAPLGVPDSATLVEGLVDDALNPLNDLDFHMPFDSTFTLYQPIWDLWMDNNLEQIHAAAGGQPLSGVNMWIGRTPNAKWNYDDMTTSWINTLRGAGYTVEVFDYNSFEDDEIITDDEYAYDLMRRMLKFHSESFGN